MLEFFSEQIPVDTDDLRDLILLMVVALFAGVVITGQTPDEWLGSSTVVGVNEKEAGSSDGEATANDGLTKEKVQKRTQELITRAQKFRRDFNELYDQAKANNIEVSDLMKKIHKRMNNPAMKGNSFKSPRSSATPSDQQPSVPSAESSGQPGEQALSQSMENPVPEQPATVPQSDNSTQTDQPSSKEYPRTMDSSAGSNQKTTPKYDREQVYRKLNNLPESNTIKQFSGDKKLFMFYDPNCPFCHSLSQNVFALSDEFQKNNIQVTWIPLNVLSKGQSEQKLTNRIIQDNLERGITSLKATFGSKREQLEESLGGDTPADWVSDRLAKNQKLFMGLAPVNKLGTPMLVFRSHSQQAEQRRDSSVHSNIRIVPSHLSKKQIQTVLFKDIMSQRE